MPDQIPLSTLRERGAAAFNTFSPSEEFGPSAAFETTPNQSPLGSRQSSALDHDSNSSREPFTNSTSSSSMAPEQANNSPPTPPEEEGSARSRDPIRRLGRAVKTNLSSDLTAGIFALSGLLCAVLVGTWGVLLARQQLDLGKWSFCKSYPNDTQVLQSSTCQRFAAKQSLDDLVKRAESGNGSCRTSSLTGTLPILVLDTVPSWMIPPTVDKSSCNLVCWDLAPPKTVEERIEIEFRLSRVTKISQHMSIFVCVSLVVVLLFCAYREYLRKSDQLPAQPLVRCTFSQTLIQDIKDSKDALVRAMPWIFFNTCFLGILVSSYAPDFRGAVEALLTLARFLMNQMFLAAISSLIGFADFHDTLHIYISPHISKLWKPMSSISSRWILPPIFIAVYLSTRSVDSVANFVFWLSMFNLCFRALQFVGDMNGAKALLDERRKCEVHNVFID